MVLALATSCSTVKFKTLPGEVTREGIAAAQDLSRVSPPPSALASLGAKGEAALNEAKKLERQGDTREAAGQFLAVAMAARQLLESPPPEVASSEEIETVLIDFHNRSLARFAELWTELTKDNPNPSLRFETTEGVIEAVSSPASDYEAGFFDRAISVDSIRGKGVVEKKRKGYGAPIVGIRDFRPDRADEFEFYQKDGIDLPLTLTIDSPQVVREDGVEITRLPIATRNPLLHETVKVGSHTFPLAASFSSHMEVILNGRNEKLWGLGGFIKADQRSEESGVFMMEPYDPDRIPVLLIHGLVSVPIIWRDIIPIMMSDPEIARRYQFMVFTYPSSYYVAESTHLLRRSLERMREKYDPEGNDPLSRDMVVIGHSMGGVISHAMVADVGDRFWNEISEVPPEQLNLDPESTAKIREAVFYQPDPAIDRVIYIATPHRGARMADAGIAGFLSGLARLPTEVLLPVRDLVAPDTEAFLKIDMGKRITSVQSLSPDSPISKALDKSPYREGVIYHSIIGDRGKGDTPDSSDGVVEYWSSHQEGAASELIVPTGHGAYEHPDAIADIRRILRLHVGLSTD